MKMSFMFVDGYRRHIVNLPGNKQLRNVHALNGFMQIRISPHEVKMTAQYLSYDRQTECAYGKRTDCSL